MVTASTSVYDMGNIMYTHTHTHTHVRRLQISVNVLVCFLVVSCCIALCGEPMTQ